MKGKRILVGVTAGIAAYKIAFLIRILKKQGADVRCIMTPASSDFISPLVLATLSENPVGIEFWNKEDGTWTNHVDYGLWADLFVIAPLTANTLSKMASGACDNLLLATYLSMKGKTLVAPAMDLDMYAHPATKTNLKTIENHGVSIIPAESGALASGLDGEGRMAEPETIATAIQEFFDSNMDPVIRGKKVLITAGPTHEAIDPVRFIGNHSSGKMGYALARLFASEGAEVVLVSGPVALTKLEGVELISVNSAEEMLEAVQSKWKEMDMGIFSAAVADYRPLEVASDKIKKNCEEFEIKLVKNPDILKWAGENKRSNQVLVGFALETSNQHENAKKKLEAKNLDFIVLNSPKDDQAGFGFDTNKITILDKNNNCQEFELKSKELVAKDILNTIKTFVK